MMGFLFFSCCVDVLNSTDAVGCETIRCLPGLDEGLMPRGFDDGPDGIYAIDFGSGGGDTLLCFANSIAAFRDVDKDRLDSMGFGGKGCLLTRGAAFDCVLGGFRHTEVTDFIGGTWNVVGSIFIVFRGAIVRGGDIRCVIGSLTETMVFFAKPVAELSTSDTINSRDELGCDKASGE
jgi:hypothetical protein